MATVYGLSREGGPRSRRFDAYLRLVRDHEGAGYQAYNPMAGQAALDTVQGLLAIDAEGVARETAEAVLTRCQSTARVELAVVVAAPGMWTHRLVTEAEHRLRPEKEQGHVQMWAGERAGVEDVRRETAAETVRMAWTGFHGPAHHVRAALVREGLALALSSSSWEPLTCGERDAVRAALAALGESRARRDVLVVAYGDPLAEELGWERLELPDRAGCRYAAELAAQWVAELGPARALRRSPGDLATPPPARAASCSR